MSMQLILPDFADELLSELTICAIIELDDPSKLTTLDERIRMQAEYSATGGSVWIRLIIDHDGKCGHIHFDVERGEADDSLATVGLDQIQEFATALEGLTVHANIFARYSIPRDRIPQGGMIATLLNVSTESCGQELGLTGATMRLGGDPFTKLRWEWDEDSGDIDATLFAKTILDIEENYLSEAVNVMRRGIDCFVFEIEETGLRNAPEKQRLQRSAEA